MIESVSKRAFSGSSGTYNVHALELAAARVRKLKGLTVTVLFLDDTEHSFHVEKKAKGSVLLDQVHQHLELVEKDYFGLQYSANGCTPTNNKPECMVNGFFGGLRSLLKKQNGLMAYNKIIFKRVLKV